MLGLRPLVLAPYEPIKAPRDPYNTPRTPDATPKKNLEKHFKKLTKPSTVLASHPEPRHSLQRLQLLRFQLEGFGLGFRVSGVGFCPSHLAWFRV